MNCQGKFFLVLGTVGRCENIQLRWRTPSGVRFQELSASQNQDSAPAESFTPSGWCDL